MRQPGPGLQLAAALMYLCGLSATGPSQAAAQSKHALLVGCTVYPNLEERFHLQGPANDVALVRDLLTTRFGLPEQNVVTLSDAAGQEALLPTHKNIEREWVSLAERAEPGDQVLVLMAGHGTQAPVVETLGNAEADGLDELFLPRDTGPWDDFSLVIFGGGGDGDEFIRLEAGVEQHRKPVLDRRWRHELG